MKKKGVKETRYEIMMKRGKLEDEEMSMCKRTSRKNNLVSLLRVHAIQFE